MKFWEALKLIEEGKKVRPACFDKHVYIDQTNLPLISMGDFYLQDLVGDKWELFEEPKNERHFCSNGVLNLITCREQNDGTLELEANGYKAEILICPFCGYRPEKK